jgi:hypothetical protein
MALCLTWLRGCAMQVTRAVKAYQGKTEDIYTRNKKLMAELGEEKMR